MPRVIQHILPRILCADMPRQRHRDCWIATLRVSIPIDATAESLTTAQDAIAGIRLPGGATVEIIAQRFGRMAVNAGNGQASNSGANVDGAHEATKQSEDAPESDTAAPQGGGGNCGTTTSKDAPDINDDPMAAEREIYLRRQREPDPDTGTLTFPDIPPALDRRVPRPA